MNVRRHCHLLWLDNHIRSRRDRSDCARIGFLPGRAARNGAVWHQKLAPLLRRICIWIRFCVVIAACSVPDPVQIEIVALVSVPGVVGLLPRANWALIAIAPQPLSGMPLESVGRSRQVDHLHVKPAVVDRLHIHRPALPPGVAVCHEWRQVERRSLALNARGDC